MAPEDTPTKASEADISAAAQALAHEQLASLCVTIIDQLRAAETKIKNLEIALTSNRHIAMAIGILMATQHLSADQAFDLLRSASQSQHRKLRELAEAVLFTGHIPPNTSLASHHCSTPAHSSAPATV